MNIETYREIVAIVDEQTYESEHQRNIAIHKYMVWVNTATQPLALSRQLREMKCRKN
jgi:hypothetical protein